jgi:hypothetical protein
VERGNGLRARRRSDRAALRHGFHRLVRRRHRLLRREVLLHGLAPAIGDPARRH